MQETNRIAVRVAALSAVDQQFRDALPLAAVNDSKLNPELGLAQIAALVMDAYADRPALARRASDLVTDPSTGRRTRRLGHRFESLTYRELWSRARALANLWHHEPARSLKANERLCILGFAGFDFATVDLAAIHNGAVVVPLQTNAPSAQLLAIWNEVAANWLATSLDCLALAADLVIAGHRPCAVLVFDYHPQVDDEREVFEAVQAKFAAEGLATILVTLLESLARGETLGAAPLFAEPCSDRRLCTVYYTSGSTGLPKGAMYPEAMVKPNWRAVSPIPILYMHYLPMNHSFGRSGVFASLGSGGICHFTANSDLSAFFDDIRVVRPTFMGIVPRICEMIYQYFQGELHRRGGGAADPRAFYEDLTLEIRNVLLGGRLLSCNFGSAPLAPELRSFMESCLGFPMDDYYGATEISGAVRNQRIMRPPVIDYKLDDVPELGYFNTDQPHPRGELRIKTASIMLGYYKRPDVSAQMFDEAGYYKTGDIMAEIGPDQLVYVDRRNNVLKLAQGEFVAIARLEALYTNGGALIRQAYIYGTSERAYLLGVFVPDEDMLRQLCIADDAAAVKAAMRAAINEVARAEQLHAFEVPRDFIVEREPFSTENGLLAGIGKYQRPKFKDRYAPRLEQLYGAIADSQASELHLLRSDGGQGPIIRTVGRAVQATLGIEPVDLAQPCSFAELGGDSLSAVSLSLLLEEIYAVEVPAGVINNPTGSLQHVADFIERARDGCCARPTCASVHGRNASEIHASDLQLEKFIDAGTLNEAPYCAPPSGQIRTVLITGANGYLGRFLCLEWLERVARVDGRVVCLVRGRDVATAARRIAEAFGSDDRDLQGKFESLAVNHLEVLAGDLGEPDLGLSAVDWQRLATSVDLIVHPAALVNHVLSYAQLFGPNVVGTAELIRLALTHRIKPFNNVSTIAAAIGAGGLKLDESADIRFATPVRRLDGHRYAEGYAHSKWAGEVLLREAHERFDLPVTVFRSDMILAHSRYVGQINVPDMFTRWLFSIVVTGLAPRSFYACGGIAAHYDGLPVDFTAEAIATLGAKSSAGYRTYHVVNPHEDGVSMDTFIDWLIAAGHPIQRIDDYADWFGRFETALRALPDRQRQRSSLPLLHQMREPQSGTAGASVSALGFRREVRTQGVGPNRDIPHLSAAFIAKCLGDLRHLRFI